MQQKLNRVQLLMLCISAYSTQWPLSNECERSWREGVTHSLSPVTETDERCCSDRLSRRRRHSVSSHSHMLIHTSAFFSITQIHIHNLQTLTTLLVYLSHLDSSLPSVDNPAGARSCYRFMYLTLYSQSLLLPLFQLPSETGALV